MFELMKLFVWILGVFFLAGCGNNISHRPAGSSPVGYQEIQFADQKRGRPLDVMIWYPVAPGTTEQAVSYKRFVRGYASAGAEFPPGVRPLPLIMLSHGTMGSNVDQSWLAEALAARGYIVAAVAHWQNTHDNHLPEETVRVWHRPADISFVLSQLLTDKTWGPRIDARRIGAAGHSAGGYTVLALAGAIYNAKRMQAYCRSSDHGPDCDLAKDADFAHIDYSDSGRAYRDDRIKAVFAVAPALGPAITEGSLHVIAIPTYLVFANNDGLALPRFNAEYYAANITGVRTTRLKQGNHFVFMSECNALTSIIIWFNKFDVCGSHEAVNRPALHSEIERDAISFFAEALPRQ
jgi:predicted dienelactone hydrolase